MERNHELESSADNARTQINYALLMYTSNPEDATRSLRAARNSIDNALAALVTNEERLSFKYKTHTGELTNASKAMSKFRKKKG